MRESAWLCAILLINDIAFGLESNKQQRYNTNLDFLLHEGGNTAPKTNTAVTQAQFSSSPWHSPTNSIPGGKDYANQFPQLGPPKPTVNTQTTLNNNINTNNKQQNTHKNDGKRDYVAPQFPTLRPPQNQQTTGKVKDLINYFDKKPHDQNGPMPGPPQNGQNNPIPSYSSILRGSTTNNIPSPTTATTFKYTQPFTQTTPRFPATKPFSFSSIVSGSNKPSTPNHPTLITPKPTTRIPVLPSAILNNNKNNNQGNSNPTDAELQRVSEELLRKDVNNAAKYVTINYQEKTTSQSKEDKAPLPLLTISPEAWNISTIQKFLPLLDNYERDTLVNEHVTPQERNEEIAFMDAVMSTSVIRHLMSFLRDKGYVTPDPQQQRDYLKQLWFSLYSRGKGKISSSGFEHIFVSELKNGEVSGLHNWIYFSKEEAANRINYLGYLKYRQFGDKGAVIKQHFNQLGVDKPVDTMFIGTSPELEMALYTLCFVTRADNDCKLKLANEDVDIVTHTFRYRSKNSIGSAYPQI